MSMPGKSSGPPEMPPMKLLHHAFAFAAPAVTVLLGGLLLKAHAEQPLRQGPTGSPPTAGSVAADPRPPMPPLPVMVSRPVVREVTDTATFAGHTHAVSTVEIRPRVTGLLTKVCFKEGSAVQEGTLLFEIDSRLQQAEMNRRQAEVKQAEAQVQRVSAQLERSRRLADRGVMDREELARLQAHREEAEAGRHVAMAGLDLARLYLEFTRIASPLSGRIGAALVGVGNLVKADETLLATVVTQDPIAVAFGLDEKTALRIHRLAREDKVGGINVAALPVHMGLADESGYPHQGSIQFMDNHLDPNTGTLGVRAVFANPGGGHPAGAPCAHSPVARLSSSGPVGARGGDPDGSGGEACVRGG